MSETDSLLFHVNGDLVPADEATVSVQDRGFKYGDAAFETLRAYGGDVFGWEAHADRLANTCELLEIAHGLSHANLHERILETLTANGLDDAYVRLSISRGVQPGKLDPQPAVDPTVVIIVKPLPRGGVGGESVWAGPATLETVKTRRIPDNAVPAAAKTHNYLNGILARLALQRGASGDPADEALLLDTDGYLAEGATSNLFFVADGVVHTPTTDQSILPGVTRSIVLDLAREEGLPVETGRYEREELLAVDEAFLTNTTWELRPIEVVDGESIGGGPITQLLSRLYDRRVERSCYEGRERR